MKSFNESFYTEDFDQEMLDFIEANYTANCDVIGWSNLDVSLCYSDCDKGFYLAYYISEGNKLTKEEFKRKIGMSTIWKRTPPKSEKVIKLEERISIMQDNLLALKEQLEEELTL